MSQPLFNPFAPPAYNGINDASPPGYDDQDFTYPFDVSLAAGQLLRDQVMQTMNDAEFEWRGIVIPIGGFAFRIADSQGYYLSDGFILAESMGGGGSQADGGAPFPIWHGIVIPAGGYLHIDLRNESAVNPVTSELLFRGVKRFRRLHG
jgi:hypothetical protein